MLTCGSFLLCFPGSSWSPLLRAPWHSLPSQCQFCVGCPTDNSARLSTTTAKLCHAAPQPPAGMFGRGGGQCTCLVQSYFGIAHPWQGPDRFPCPIALKAIAGCSVACTKHDVCNGIASQPVWWVRNLAHRTNFSGRPGFQPFKLLTSTRN